MGMIFLDKISSEICEDTYDGGMGKSTCCGLRDTHIGFFFHSFDSAMKYLHDHYGLVLSADGRIAVEGDDFEFDCDNNIIRWSRMVADHSNEQNGGWFEPTDDEYKAWQKGETMLYTEDFAVKYDMCFN